MTTTATGPKVTNVEAAEARLAFVKASPNPDVQATAAAVEAWLAAAREAA